MQLHSKHGDQSSKVLPDDAASTTPKKPAMWPSGFKGCLGSTDPYRPTYIQLGKSHI
jgi:hypothetical protein